MTAHDGGTGLRLRGVPAGHITRRNARTATTREVDLLPFSLGATPVTLGDWKRSGIKKGPANRVNNYDARV